MSTNEAHKVPTNEASTLTSEVLASLGNAEVFDQDDNRFTWSELTKRKRVVVIFIRHFWCVNCKAYVRLMGEQIPPKNLPEGTSIIIIGCGQSAPIRNYLPTSQYPIYAHPSLTLHKALGFGSTTAGSKAGEEKAYESSLGGLFKRTVSALKEGPGKNLGHVNQVGPFALNGGEMILEEDGSCSFLHRMKHTADHTELDVLADKIGATYIPGEDLQGAMSCRS